MERRRKNQEESDGEELLKEDAFASLVRKMVVFGVFYGLLMLT